MATNLLKSGTIDRYPDIKVILPHGGGAIPSVLPRMAFVLGEECARLLSSFFYYDLCAATTPGQLAAMNKLASPDKLLMGVIFLSCLLR